MHIIGFSHHYTKMHGQTYGTLVSVRKLSDIQFNRLLSGDCGGRVYDTEWRDADARLADCSQFAEIQDDERLQLIFIGEKQIPFTTYREIPKNYTPWRKSRTYRKSLPYSELIGDIFAFKYKGKELPWGLASKISTRKGGCVKIFD